MFAKLFPPFVAIDERGSYPHVYTGYAIAAAIFVPMLIDYLF